MKKNEKLKQNNEVMQHLNHLEQYARYMQTEALKAYEHNLEALHKSQDWYSKLYKEYKIIMKILGTEIEEIRNEKLR